MKIEVYADADALAAAKLIAKEARDAFANSRQICHSSKRWQNPVGMLRDQNGWRDGVP
jgi:hypothetical protein